MVCGMQEVRRRGEGHDKGLCSGAGGALDRRKEREVGVLLHPWRWLGLTRAMMGWTRQGPPPGPRPLDPFDATLDRWTPSPWTLDPGPLDTLPRHRVIMKGQGQFCQASLGDMAPPPLLPPFPGKGEGTAVTFF